MVDKVQFASDLKQEAKPIWIRQQFLLVRDVKVIILMQEF